MEIKLAQKSDLALYWAHCSRHINESGRNGDVIFTPIENTWDNTFDNFAKQKDAWNKAVTEVGWERCFIVGDKTRIVGSLTLLQAVPQSSCLHRAMLMMGLERSHRGQGLGNQLMGAAITWAKEQPSLEWIQLYVFANNPTAHKLYLKWGFKENGRVEDMFRVRGEKITDISMALKI